VRSVGATCTRRCVLVLRGHPYGLKGDAEALGVKESEQELHQAIRQEVSTCVSRMIESLRAWQGNHQCVDDENCRMIFNRHFRMTKVSGILWVRNPKWVEVLGFSQVSTGWWDREKSDYPRITSSGAQTAARIGSPVVCPARSGD